jgi:hypothetical protein
MSDPMPGRNGHRRAGSSATGNWTGSAPGATVSLQTAAHALSISPADAQRLAEAGAFPCDVVRSGGGYRIPFRALLHVLRSSPGTGPGPQDK